MKFCEFLAEAWQLEAGWVIFSSLCFILSLMCWIIVIENKTGYTFAFLEKIGFRGQFALFAGPIFGIQWLLAGMGSNNAVFYILAVFGFAYSVIRVPYAYIEKKKQEEGNKNSESMESNSGSTIVDKKGIDSAEKAKNPIVDAFQKFEEIEEDITQDNKQISKDKAKTTLFTTSMRKGKSNDDIEKIDSNSDRRLLDSDKFAEAKRIENMLEAKYADYSRQNHIDKSQESEIGRFVEYANSSIESYNNTYKSDLNYEYDLIRNEHFSNIRDSRLTPYKNHMRNILKDYIENLKQMFDEVDTAAERFYKKGISMENQQKLVDVMEKIWDNGESLTISFNEYEIARGALPVRYKSKISKWELKIDDLPKDIESADRQREARAKKLIEDKYNDLMSDISQLDDKLLDLDSSLKKQDKKLEKLNLNLEMAKTQYESSKTEIISIAESNKADIQNEIDRIQKRIEELRTTKQRLETSLAKTFLIAIIKKKKIGKEILENEFLINIVESDMQKLQLELTEEEKQKDIQIECLNKVIANLEKKIKD